MYRQMSKRRKRAQLTFVYGIMTLAVVVSVAVLILVILGYRFNRYDGRVEQGGLVQFDSKPVGATVTLDTIQLANRTPSKVTVTAGTHTVTMQKDGYSTWRKDMTVSAGSVLWLNYARMLPATLKSTVIWSQPFITSALASPDGRWMALIGNAGDPTVTVVDLNATIPASTSFVLPVGSYTIPAEGSSHSFSVVGWDYDNRHAMIKHVYGDRIEFLSVDTRENGETVNVSSTLGVDALDVTYSYRGNTTVNILTATREVRQGDLSARTLSGPLLSNVQTVNEFDRSTLTYTTLPDAAGVRQAGYLTIGANRPRIVRTTSPGAELQFRVGRYYNTDYLAIAEGAAIEILSGSLTASDSKVASNWKRIASIPITMKADAVRFSPGENRFVAVQEGAAITTYDLELSKMARSILSTPPGRAVGWLDGYHIASTVGGVASFTDFDGTNYQVIAPKNVQDLVLTISADERYVYYVASKDGQMVLTRTNLIAD